MTHVLYLHSTSEIGGSDISLLRIIETLDRRRFRPTVVLPRQGPLVQSLEARDCRVLVVPAMKKLTTRRGRAYLAACALNYPRAVWQLVRIIRRERVDLVHTNTIHNLYGFAAARLARRPHIWHVREIVWQSAALRALEARLATRFADRVVVTSDAVAAMFDHRRGGRPAHVRKIPNGVDLDRYRPDLDGARIFADLGLDACTPLVGLVCRLDYWKGVETFLHAAAACRARRPGAHFLVVGGPIEGQEAYGERLRRLAGDLGLADVVHFTDWRYGPADMPAVYAALSVFVLASIQPEPFGLVLLEAMAAGKPVVATDHGGPREICVDGDTGWRVPPGDATAMAEAIARLLADPARARRMGEAGRRRAEQLYDQRATVRALETLYGELTAG